jgi:hypothetical protein
MCPAVRWFALLIFELVGGPRRGTCKIAYFALRAPLVARSFFNVASISTSAVP